MSWVHTVPARTSALERLGRLGGSTARTTLGTAHARARPAGREPPALGGTSGGSIGVGLFRKNPVVNEVPRGSGRGP